MEPHYECLSGTKKLTGLLEISSNISYTKILNAYSVVLYMENSLYICRGRLAMNILYDDAHFVSIHVIQNLEKIH